MAKDNTKPKAETKPEDEQNSVQQATEDEQNAAQQAPTPSPTNDGQNEDNTPSGAEEEQAAAGASPCPTDEGNNEASVEDEQGVNPEPDEGSGPYIEVEGLPIKLVVISARGLALRQEPDKQSAMLSVLPNGTVLTNRPVEQIPPHGWIAVQTKDDKAGYVDTRFVTVVE